MSYSTQAILLAVVPKVPAVLSLLGSSYIVRDVLTDKRKRKKPYHRIMLGMSCSDISASTVYFLGTWLIPRGTVGQYGPVFMAAGNDGTCNLSGFFTQFAVCSPLYNGTLALYYLLMIRFGWKEDRVSKLEPIFHGLPIVFALATAITGIAVDLYGSVEWLCWINPDPPQANFRIYQWAFLFVPLWICALFVTVVMVILWWTMKQLERAMSHYAGAQTSRQRNKRSQEIAFQGILYVSAFYITWFFPSLQRIIEVVANKNYFGLQMLDTALLPLQGLFNVMIYLRPRFKQYRRHHPDMSWSRVLLNVPNSGRSSVAGLRDTVAGHSTFFQPRRRTTANASEIDVEDQVQASSRTTNESGSEADDSTRHSTVEQATLVDEEAGVSSDT